MNIVDIQTEVKYIELKTPFITALRRVESVEFVRVTFRCENGLIGIGEAPATVAITGEGIDDILHSIDFAGEILLFQSPQDAIHEIYGLEIGSSAKAAMDIALVSLLAQEKNQKLYEYFGAKEARAIESDITISFNEIDVMLEDVQKAVDEGIKKLKIKVAKNIKHAIDIVTQVSKKYPHVEILVDANQAWSVTDTLHFIKAMKNISLELIEQPLQADDLDGMKSIKECSSVSILADESVFSLDDVKYVIENGCADMINIKLMKCGGLTKAIEILEYAREKRVPCMLGSMLEGPYSINSALHLAIAYRDVIKYVDLDSPLLYKEYPKELDFYYEKSRYLLK